MSDAAPTPFARRLAARFGLGAEGLRSLGAFESEVVAGVGPYGPTIVKVVAPDHRTREQVEAEVAWVRALHEAGVPVAEPLASRSGAWTEVDVAGEEGAPPAASPGPTTGPTPGSRRGARCSGGCRRTRACGPPRGRRGDAGASRATSAAPRTPWATTRRSSPP